MLVESTRWPAILDDLIVFRRFLRDQFRVPVRAEIKANYLLRNGGPFRPLALSEQARFAIYRGFMRLHAKIGVMAFAVVIRKDVMIQRGLADDPRAVAWGFLLQRLERFTTNAATEVILFHDEGEGAMVQRAARRARRFGAAGSMFGTGSLPRPARLLLDDPVTRRSQESYLIQLSDLVAYAAFRRLYPAPTRPVQIVPVTMWDELQAARYGEVNRYSGGPPGIVAWP